MPDSYDNAGFDALVRTIESLQERIRHDGETIGSNEIRTRTALVDPLLNALGWDTTDPAMVIPEYAAGGGMADYALLKVTPDENTPVIAFIEAKRLHEPLESHRAQMLTYANMAGVKYAGLTNGDRWELYEVFKEAPLHERRILDISIRWEPAFDCAVKFLPLQWLRLETGEALSLKSVQRLLIDALKAKASPTTVAMLLTRGANANVRLHEGDTLLHWAVRYTEPATVAVLLNHGAEINAEDERGHTPLHLAAMSDQHKETVALLLEKGASVDKEARGISAGTPLHVAAGRGALAVAAILLDAGSNIHCKNQYGQTPLQEAIELVSLSDEAEHVVNLLLDRGADIETTDVDGNTPLHSAAVYAGKLVPLLLSRGARIEAINNEGETPLHRAAMAWHCLSASLLLDRGANIEARNHQGFTPLHLAFQDPVVWHPVIDGKIMGPDVPYTHRMYDDEIGRESAGYVSWEMTHEMVDLLLEYEADRNALTNDGRTAYDIARAWGADEEVLGLLNVV